MPLAFRITIFEYSHPAIKNVTPEGVITLAPDLRLWDPHDFTVCCKADLWIAGMRRLARNQVLI